MEYDKTIEEAVTLKGQEVVKELTEVFNKEGISYEN